MIKKIIIVIFFLAFFGFVKAETSVFKDIQPNDSKEYIIRLTNGDIITGSVVEFMNDPTEGEGIRFRTELGTGIIYANQVAEIREKEEEYRHAHRVFLLPTAEPIRNNYFVGDFELLFLYAGGGIGDFFSFTAGRTIIPGITSSEQISVLDAKFTLFNTYFDSLARKLSFAIGGNAGWVNNENQMLHLYAVTTIHFYQTRLTANLFYKNFGEDYYTLHFGEYSQYLKYNDGAFGIGLGIDSKISRRHDLHIIGELWNTNVTRPSHTGVLLGLRLCNSLVSMDFGLAFATAGYIIPVTSFVYTPF